MLRCKITFFIELRLDLFVLLLQAAHTLGKELFYNKRNGTAFFIYIDSTDNDNMIAFAYSIHGPAHTAAEQNGPDRALLIM